MATLFRHVPSIYFPVRLEYRGRLYCTTEYLNYQGINLAKGLLQLICNIPSGKRITIFFNLLNALKPLFNLIKYYLKVVR